MTTIKNQALNNRQVKLYVEEMTDGADYTISISNVHDLKGNIISGVSSKTFSAIGVRPQALSLAKYDSSTLDFEFDSEVRPSVAEIVSNYTLSGTPAKTITAVDALSDGSTVRLTLDSAIPYGTYNYTVEAINIADTAGNLIDPAHNSASASISIGPFGDHATLGTNLVAYYKLDGDVTDAYTNNLDGINYGDPPDTAPSAVINSALDFTGVDNKSFYLPDSPAILDVITTVTISAWVYIPAYPGAGAFYCIGGRRGQIVYYIVGTGADQGKLYTRVYRSGGIGSIFSTATVSLSAWCHTAITYDGSTVYSYVNGSSSSTACSGPMTVTDATNPWRFAAVRNILSLDGNINQHSFLKGYLDEIGIWNRVLSAAEIAMIYNSSSGLPFSS